MKELKDLTPEIKAKIPETINRVAQAIYRGDRYESFDIKKAEAYINFVYEFNGYAPPRVEVVDNLWELNEVGNHLEGVTDPDKYTNKLEYLFVCDPYASVYFTWYKFIKDELEIPAEIGPTLDKFHDLYMQAGIFSGIYREDVCYICKFPKKVHVDEQFRLHNENGSAVEWAGKPFECYYWRGYKVPKILIEEPEKIDKEWIRENDNLEIRRCLIEKIGPEEFFNKLSDGKGLKIIDETTDRQGNPMALLEYPFGEATIQSLRVVDPSTGRVYYVEPPNQESKDCWEAKKSTFKNKGIKYRHGDVGIFEIGKDYEFPLIET